MQIEQKDVRPASGGEYFYGENIQSYFGQYHSDNHPACFVCRAIGRSWSYFNIHALVQSWASSKRIASMFKPGVCYSSFSGIENPFVIISACEEHRRHLEHLLRLASDGVITSERVARAEQAAVSRFEFHELVAKEAQGIWDRQEGGRRQRNWYDSLERCCKELGHVPSQAERKACAERIHRERKDAQALDDWLLAEKRVAALYTIAPS